MGMWYFKEASSTANAISIWLGLAAGVLFVFAKQVSPVNAEGFVYVCVQLCIYPYACECT